MKKNQPFFILSLLILFTSCGQGQVNNHASEIPTVDSNIVERNENEIQQRHYFDTAFVANKQLFKFEIRDINEDELTLTFIRNEEKINVDTLQSGGLVNVEFVDFDKDGNSDILFTYMGNNSSYDIYLFDKIANDFKYLTGFDRFPDAIQLKTDPKYYYSYHRAGCADMNWISDLFYIENFQTIHIAHIYGQGCDYEVKENPQVIQVYKVLENNEEHKKEIEKLPYLKNINESVDKWIFIEKYWNKNIGKFK